MIVTYLVTIVIFGAWIFNMLTQKRLIFKTTPLDIPLLLFLGANILSTFFSVDKHTSFWGYYSRSNGGLLSLITYLILYWAFVSNMTASHIKTLLKIGLVSGFIISLWGILEHFGISPSCVILRQELNASCWVQDVAARVFATLGQPNWMAAYLSMLIFPALYFLLTSREKWKRIMYFLSLITMYLSFTFTYSRGPTLGFLGGFAVFVLLWFTQKRFKEKIDSNKVESAKILLITILSLIAVNIFFGSALTSFRLVSKFAAPSRPAITLPATSVTQLENGGTESGQIRFIVWKGAIDIFKNNPIFGTGPETFAYSYYQYRPKEHNMTSEWDFLYNKAHNEYLNYLATTGIVGFAGYMLVIAVFLLHSLNNLKFKIFNLHSNFKLKISNLKTIDQNSQLLITALLGSYVSYLIYNFFLFSVVIIAIFFFLFPAMVFIVAESVKDLKLAPNIKSFLSFFEKILHNSFYLKGSQAIIVIISLLLFNKVINIWIADTYFAQGERQSESGNPGAAYNKISDALELNPNEPFYRSELAFSAAQASAALHSEDSSISASLKDTAVEQMSEVLAQSPKNVSFWRTAIKTYFELAVVDKVFLQKTLDAVNSAINLAPSDPKLYYNKALILDTMGKKDEEVKVLLQALDLKPNYNEALEQLKEATASVKTK